MPCCIGLTAQITDCRIDSFLISLHRTSTLRHDPETQATVINLLLRSYIGEANLYDQADKLVARAPFPRGKAGNGQIARYEYYVGESVPARQASGP